MTATAGAIRELEDQHEQLLVGQRLTLERAEYEAERAERQFDACEPENRLVARTLERKLEDALAQAERERGKLIALEHARPSRSPSTSASRSPTSPATSRSSGRRARQPIATASCCCAR